MIYMIDAWLDCANPRLRIYERNSGKEYLVLEGKTLNNYREQGLLDCSVLCSINQTLIQEITEQLLSG
ncbi:hypothetical protein [Entomomonas asaccharolytica]|uniref:Uncharacterized protein n=1 Tax=Entomomonas asaccharolytica TaxID=2785331 RepID=A0A974NF79_9GAMM|nr:hypothetical protein [Entomomonas asaccharolytica]QQP85516.1 hypothetical protein JHT90_14255 [Entomomonas asaccharolytica]